MPLTHRIKVQTAHHSRINPPINNVKRDDADDEVDEPDPKGSDLKPEMAAADRLGPLDPHRRDDEADHRADPGEEADQIEDVDNRGQAAIRDHRRPVGDCGAVPASASVICASVPDAVKTRRRAFASGSRRRRHQLAMTGGPVTTRNAAGEEAL